MRRASIVTLVLVALALPAAASAQTRYVQNGGLDGTDCTNPGAKCATIAWAVTQAANGDTIDIGPGAYSESVQTDKVLTFVGAGSVGLPSEVTTIQGPNGSSGMAGKPAMTLPSGGTVRALRAQGGTGGSTVAEYGELGGDAIAFDSAAPAPASLRLEDVVAIGGNGGLGSQGRWVAGNGVYVVDGPGPVSLSMIESEARGGMGVGRGVGVWVDGATTTALISKSQIPNQNTSGDALFTTDGAQTTVVESSLSADFAVSMYGGTLNILRSRLESEGGTLYVTPSSGETSRISVVDSLMASSQAAAVYIATEEGSSATASAVGATVIGHGTEAVNATRTEGAGPANVILRNSIARNLAPPGYPLPTSDLFADGGSIDGAFSSFTTTRQENGGAVTAPGSAGNVAGDPDFADPASGSYSLQGDSPLIDRGDPSLVVPGQLDLVGNARSLDSNFDCLAAPDIGAYELTSRGTACPADAVPVVSGFGLTNRVFAPKGKRRGHKVRASARRKAKVKRGTKFTYTLSEPARVGITIERRVRKRKRAKPRFVKVGSLNAQEKAGRQSSAFSGWLKGKPLKPGRYRATIVATDPAGQASNPQRATFRVVRG